MTNSINNFTIDTSLPMNLIYKKTEELSSKEELSELNKNICELNTNIRELINRINGVYQAKTGSIPPPPPFLLSNPYPKKIEASSIEPEKIIPTLSNKQEPLQSTEEIKKYLNNDNPITNPKEILNSIKNQNKANAIRRTKSFNLSNVSPISKKEEITTIAEEVPVIIDGPIIENNERKKQFTQTKQLFEPHPK